ncbi:ribosomal RNA large subunit methyltransferase E-like isoform X2 [Macrosteles quadrilineatus]|uniref:ribosomal RNA large subunit methyltransferase E-like isoform X2 n=1 Tax=Macrosteles quadrilineatus TaxID=74068 RepID=UPI0023E2A031|nr:ribosomal RNA large subunit methyltransferase E-like isoform X2 [Macrosteles quadrilineatus]XP_054285318.1 ribosomal RNA large subunit methyltransferase E-like isoform X2 [Macrosteles quadrilineatus]
MGQITKRIIKFPKFKKSLSGSSKKWLQRQFRDEYCLKAQYDDYRCRSAYKLLEIHDKYKLFKPGQTVVDLGCCPGSWTQVAVNATRAKYEKFGSFVLGMDLQKTYPIKGAKIMDKMDFLDPSSQKLIKQALKGRKADVLTSDMAPNTTGIRDKDHMQVAELCYSTLKFVPRVCKLGSSLVMKAFDGVECKQIIKDLRFMYEKGIVVHPKATRQPSSEFFYLGLKYRGNKLEPKQQSEPEEEFFEPSDPFEGIEDCNVPSSLSSDELM